MLAGCGSGHTSIPVAAPATAKASPNASPSPTNYDNPQVLAAAIEKILRQRLRDKSGSYYLPGVHPAGTTCVPHGAGRDFCVTSLSGDHPNISATAIIAPDGNGFITK
jgi:hypothetical protein